MIYALATVVYFTLNAARMQQSMVQGSMVDIGWIEYITKMLVYSLTCYMFSFEILQLMDKKMQYFLNFSNWVD